MRIDRPESVLLRARVPAQRLRNVERVLDRLGLKPSDAINMLLAQIELSRGLPFRVSLEEPLFVSGDMQAAEWTEALGEY